MEADHPPVDVLRLGARAAAILGVFAGVVRIDHLMPNVTWDASVLLWVVLSAVFVGATALALLRPRHEGVVGGALATSAAVATLVGGGVQPGAVLGWTHGYALLFFAAGLFFLSAWAWNRREEAVRPRRVHREDAEHVEG